MTNYRTLLKFNWIYINIIIIYRGQNYFIVIDWGGGGVYFLNLGGIRKTILKLYLLLNA